MVVAATILYVSRKLQAGPDSTSPRVHYLFDQNGESLVLERLGELYVLCPLIVDGQWSHNHVSLATQQFPHHPIPLFLVAVVHLQ